MKSPTDSSQQYRTPQVTRPPGPGAGAGRGWRRPPGFSPEASSSATWPARSRATARRAARNSLAGMPVTFAALSGPPKMTTAAAIASAEESTASWATFFARAAAAWDRTVASANVSRRRHPAAPTKGRPFPEHACPDIAAPVPGPRTAWITPVNYGGQQAHRRLCPRPTTWWRPDRATKLCRTYAADGLPRVAAPGPK
jgi:hypothetical protein